MPVKIFLSTVSDEFGVYRDGVRSDLTSHNVEVKIQEDFENLGGGTLDDLDVYISKCNAVIHLVGDMTGSPPSDTERLALLRKYPDLLERCPQLEAATSVGVGVTYTQWEAWLAIYHAKTLQVAVPADGAARGSKHAPTNASKHAQAAHLERLKASGRWPRPPFKSPEDLANQVWRTIPELIALGMREHPRRPRNLPFASLGSLFKGREKIMTELHAALQSSPVAVAGKALHGLGGVGKTRLAIEYAHAHAEDYTALLFLAADTPEKLFASLAALAGSEILDLPEKDVTQDSVKIAAALKWFDAHPGWLTILDNVDDAKAAEAAEALLGRLAGGHVLITGRHPNFSPAVETLELDVLALEHAVAFLLERAKKRAKTPDDESLARELATELGNLALGLAQAAAYIDTQRIDFARYLALWRESREKVLNWFDKRLVSYNHDVGLAATWATSVEKLTPQGLRLLELCAFLDPAPIPRGLLDVPNGEEPFDADEALADLFAYSLATPAKIETGKTATPGFTVHRLVQDFARRRMDEAHRREMLQAALEWLDSAFVGEPNDARSWQVLDPLAPHALAIMGIADAAQITEPTGRLMNSLGILQSAKARLQEAEPLYRRALAIGAAIYRPDDPKVAAVLNNLAELLCATDQIAEAEQLLRRSLGIYEANYGADHSMVAASLNNFAELLSATNRFDEAEPLYRRALAIDEGSYGPGHPNVASDLNNLAQLLCATSRLAEAEPLCRRALAIFEESYGPDHPMVAIGLGNLADLLCATNRFAEAEPLSRRALAIARANHAPDHPNVATFLNNLAQTLYKMGQLVEAELLFRSALVIFEASYGAEHTAVASGLNNLANLLCATGRVGQAEPLSRQHLEIFLAFNAQAGHEHPNWRDALNSYCRILLAAGRDEAQARGEIAALLAKHGMSLA